MWRQLSLSSTLTALVKLSGFKFCCIVNRMHVDSNSLSHKNLSSMTFLSTQLTLRSFDGVVNFLGAGHKQKVILLSHRQSLYCSRLIYYALISMYPITVSLKTVLPFCRNGSTSFQCQFNVHEIVKKRAKDCNVSSILWHRLHRSFQQQRYEFSVGKQITVI